MAGSIRNVGRHNLGLERLIELLQLRLGPTLLPEGVHKFMILSLERGLVGLHVYLTGISI